MKLANVIEGGLAGATTLTLLQEALHKIDADAPRPIGIAKQIKKVASGKKKGSKAYIKLAGELISGSAYFGLTGLGKKKNAVLRGGLLGAAAGLGAVLLQNHDGEDLVLKEDKQRELKKKILTVTLYTAGGVLAGLTIKNMKRAAKGMKKKSKK